MHPLHPPPPPPPPPIIIITIIIVIIHSKTVAIKQAVICLQIVSLVWILHSLCANQNWAAAKFLTQSSHIWLQQGVKNLEIEGQLT